MHQAKTGSSQTAYPWRATVRTLLANAGAGLLVLATVLGVVKDSYGDAMPEHLTAWIVGAVAFLTATATAITRIMAIDGVNKFLTYIGLGAMPKDIQAVHVPASAELTVEPAKVPYQSIIKYQDDVVTAEKTLDSLPTQGRHVLNLEEGK